MNKELEDRHRELTYRFAEKSFKFFYPLLELLALGSELSISNEKVGRARKEEKEAEEWLKTHGPSTKS